MTALAGSQLGPKEYYSAYGKALKSLFDAILTIKFDAGGEVSDEFLENIAAASLLFLCGGHRGCSQHLDEEEAQSVRLETILICRHVDALASGMLQLRGAPLNRAA